MLFHTWTFWVFFLLVLISFYSLPFRAGRVLLLVASYIFYMWWNPTFALLIVASTAVDYMAGALMPSSGQKARKSLLIGSILVNLGILGFFKYYNFFTASLAAVLGLPSELLVLKILLPVGISFYTFQSMSYTIDIYRDHLKPVRNPIDFALYVSFFPQLVAGPIVRASEFLPQLATWKSATGSQIKEGIALMLIGLIKKMVIADNFALVSDAYFQNVSASPGFAPAWTGTLAFSMQIFFDFSGYTDIARGCAKVLGFEFPVNFLRPYLSWNIREFWRRWHISLSTWLRDYLYIPLGGNRKTELKTYRNLLVTMLLGGLWHGASWNFVIWGAYHGFLLSCHRVWTQFTGTHRKPTFLSYFAGTTVTFVLVLWGWVFFRAQNLEDSLLVLHSMLDPSTLGEPVLTPGLWFVIGASLGIGLLEEFYGLLLWLFTGPGWIRVPTYVLSFLILELFSVTDQQIPFVYFQF